MKYNYVIFGSDADYYRVTYNDINNYDCAYYLYDHLDINSRLLTNLYRLHTTPRVNKIIKLPLQSLWNPLIFRRVFAEKKPICFIFFGRRERIIKNGIIEYLKKKYPDSKYVCFYQDLILNEDSFLSTKNKFDLIVTYDHQDAKKYGILHYSLIYSPYEIPDDNDIPPSDVYFIGKAKNRLNEIISAYEKLRNAGLKCDFHITGVPAGEQKYAGEIDYCSQIPYIENLKRMKAAKCLLEIMQKGGHGYTLRVCEAIMYDKKMLTNNPEVEKAPFYSPERISTFKTADEIDTDFVLREPVSVDYHYKDKLSPMRFLEYIDRQLTE